MHESAYLDAERFARNYVMESVKVIDIGSLDINGSMKTLFTHCQYVGADITNGKNVDLKLSGPYHWPEIQDHDYDVAISSQVLEHVPRPWTWMPEIVRIVKPGGLVYICSPNTMSYHTYPVDCWRVWPDGLRALMEDAGLEIVECHMNGRDTTGIGRKSYD